MVCVGGVTMQFSIRKSWGWLLAASGMLLCTLLYPFRRRVLGRLLRLPPLQNHVRRTMHVEVRTPDGVCLRGDHYAPQIKGSAPTLLIRTPYGRNERHSIYGALLAFFAWRFAERGYHVLVQDVRGRFDSEGEFVPYLNERADGLATLAWLRQQSWFNGKLGTWGPSYLGMVQWVIADQPEVGAMMPIFTGSRLHPVIFPDGVFSYGLMMRWIAILHVIEKYRGNLVFSALLLPLEVERLVRRSLHHLPVNTGDTLIVGQHAAYYDEWLANTQPDAPLWQQVNAMVDWAHIHAPVHLIAGWYDFFQRVQLEDYARLKGCGTTPYLTIGPWGHFNDANGLLTGLHEGLAWFEAHLKTRPATSRPRPELTPRPDPVKVYISDLKQWHTLADYPPQTTPRALYLAKDQRLVETPPDQSGQAAYIYDPRDPTPAYGGAQFQLDLHPVKDNRRLENRPDIITFTTEPLTDDLVIVGAVRLTLYVRTGGETADFYARLCDLHPDGHSFNVCDGLFHLMEKTGCIEVDLWSAAHRFRAGHCLHLIIGGGAYPRWDRNPGVKVMPQSLDDLHIITETVYFGPEQPSRLMLPVFTPQP